MNTPHLFTIPEWLPNTLLPEIWAIIFHWKWRLEMKEILKELVFKMRDYSTKPYFENCIYTQTENCIYGNRWLRTEKFWSDNNSWPYLNSIPKYNKSLYNNNNYPYNCRELGRCISSACRRRRPPSHPGIYVDVKPKCGIEFMKIERFISSNPSNRGRWLYCRSRICNCYTSQYTAEPLNFLCQKSKKIYKHITEDLNIKCSKIINWNEMVKLLRSV